MKNNLAESLDEINARLIDFYGIDTISGNPMFRITWSEDELEMRWTSFTDEGLSLIHPEVREYPKYKQWIHEKYIIERLTLLTEIKVEGAPVSKVSYECIWVFEDKFGNYLPPRISASRLVIDTIYAAEGKESLVKYKDELINEPLEAKEIRLNKLQDELFGDENDITDALAYHEGVSLYGPKFGES